MTAQRLNQLHAGNEQSAKVKSFIDVARIVALSRGNSGAVKALVHDHRVRLAPVVKQVFESSHKVYGFDPDLAARQKANVSAGTTLDSGWALPLAEYNNLAAGFLENLKNRGAFDRMLPFMRRVPFRARVGANTTGLIGVTTPQASVKPISRMTLSGSQIDETKVTVYVVITEELARFGSTAAGNLFEVELSNGVAVQTDSEFITILSSGATSNGSSGVTAEHVRNDLRGMLAAVTTGQRSQLFLLMTSAVAKTLAVMSTTTGDAAFPDMQYNGGEIGGIPVIVSDGVPANTMLLVDASQVAAACESVQLDSSDQALLQLDNVGDSPITASTSMTSLWQNNLVALRAERYIGVEKLTSAGVCVLTGIAYVGDSPGP